MREARRSTARFQRHTQTGRQAWLRGTHYEPGGKMNAGEGEARRSVLFAMKAGEERESFSRWKNGGEEKI